MIVNPIFHNFIDFIKRWYLVVPDVDCGEKADGDYPNPKKACSMFYISCSGGQTYWRACPPDLDFDKETLSCKETQ